MAFERINRVIHEYEGAFLYFFTDGYGSPDVEAIRDITAKVEANREAY